jgi:hypothetical protein
MNCAEAAENEKESHTLRDWAHRFEDTHLTHQRQYTNAPNSNEAATAH